MVKAQGRFSQVGTWEVFALMAVPAQRTKVRFLSLFMVDHDRLCYAISDYSQLLAEAATPRVEDWPSFVLNNCAKYCLYIETELLTLSEEEAETCRVKAASLCKSPIPSLDDLRHALRYLYLTLINNVYLPNELYWMICSTYEFLDVAGGRQKALLEVRI